VRTTKREKQKNRQTKKRMRFLVKETFTTTAIF